MFVFQTSINHIVHISCRNPRKLREDLLSSLPFLQTLKDQREIALIDGAVEPRSHTGILIIEFPGKITAARIEYLRLIMGNPQVVASIAEKRDLTFVEAIKISNSRKKKTPGSTIPAVFVFLTRLGVFVSTPVGPAIVQGPIIYSWTMDKYPVGGYQVTRLHVSTRDAGVAMLHAEAFLKLLERFL